MLFCYFNKINTECLLILLFCIHIHFAIVKSNKGGRGLTRANEE